MKKWRLPQITMPIMKAFKGLLLQPGKLVANIKFGLDASLRQPKCYQLGHERFIFMAQRG